MTNLLLLGFENNYFVINDLYDWFLLIGGMFVISHLVTKFILWMGE